MNTNILKTNTGKQILGACAGMAIAAVVYVGIDQVSDLNVKGLLVSTDTVTENAGEISINSKDVDEATLRRIQGRALTVANQLDAASSSVQAETPLTQHAAERGAQRQRETEISDNFSSAPTYVNNPNKFMTEEQRNAIRAARIRPQFTEAAPATVTPITFENPPEETAAIMAVPQGDDGLHSGAGPAPVSTNLPNSGLGLNLLVLGTLVLAFVSTKTTWRTQAASLIHGIRLV